MKYIEKQMTDTDIDEMLEQADINGDGQISYEGEKVI